MARLINVKWFLAPLIIIIVLFIEIFINKNLFFNYEKSKLVIPILPAQNSEAVNTSQLISLNSPRYLNYSGYVHKIRIKSNAKNNAHYNIVTSSSDSNGNEKSTVYSGVIHPILGEDVIKIESTCSNLYIRAMGSPFSITSLVIDNTYRTNWIRISFIIIVTAIILLLTTFRKFFVEKIENGFFLVSVLFGLFLSTSIPVNTLTSWDDETHFKNIYTLSFFKDAIITRTVNDHSGQHWNYSTHDNPFPHHIFDTLEDQKLYFKKINSRHNLDRPDKLFNHEFVFADIGYVTQSSMLWLGRKLGLSYHLFFILGRIGNLLLYVITCYLAIKSADKYKPNLAVLALLPTPIFLASSYSYDNTVTAFIILGTSLAISQITRPSESLTSKMSLYVLCAFIIGVLPKAIYAPVILILLLLPRSKFKSQKNEIRYKLAVVFIFFLLMSTFILPTLISPRDLGDARGGETSVSKQLEFIFHDPFSYISILVSNLWQSFLNRILNEGVSFWAYLGRAEVSIRNICIMTLMFVTFTSNNPDRTLNFKSRLYILFICTTIIILIYTALYLDFTPVRSLTINGIQGRYFLPILFLLVIAISPAKVINFSNTIRYNLIILFSSSLVLSHMSYYLILKRFWL